MVGIGNMDRNVNLNLYNSIMEIIDGKMKKRLESPLHLVAYFLNPYYSYTDSSIFGDEEVMDGFISAVETFYHDDYDKAKKNERHYDKQNRVLNEDKHKFKHQGGHFAKPVSMAGCWCL